MSFSKFAARRRGFTLIEMLIVIVVIAILALIVIPRIMGAARRAKESTLRGNLHEIRTAVGHFEADCGCYPASLQDLLLTKANEPTAGIDDAGTSVPIPSGSYEGPYFTVGGGLAGSGMPVNPFQTTAANKDNINDVGTHWTYTNGRVSCAVPTGTTVDKTPYSEL